MNDEQRSDDTAAEFSAEAADDHGVERREVLVRLGKLAALTPPAVVAMLVTARPAAASA